MLDRRTAITKEAQAIIRGIENATPLLSRIALRARRLAQLLDDDAAFMWLSLECSGASKGARPERDWKDWSAATRGMEKYIKLHAVADFANADLEKLAQEITAGRAPERPRVLGSPLAQIEASKELPDEFQEQLSRSGNTQALLVITMYDHERQALLGRVASAIPEWATGIYLAHQMGDARPLS